MKRTGEQVRIVWKDHPLGFHNLAEPASELAAFAFKEKKNAGFWAVYRLLLDVQPDFDDATLERVAKDAGLDAAKAMAAVRAHKFKQSIDADADLADDVDAPGTPTFFINGRRLAGAQPFEQFQALIDEALAKARELVKNGTPPKKVYDAIMTTAEGPALPPKKAIGPAPAGAAFRGRADAKVVIQEFADFQCPFCARVEPTLVEVLKTYGQRVKLVWRHRPLSAIHSDAALASEAAQEALKQKGMAGFWKMHDALFESLEKGAGVKPEVLERCAEQIGLIYRPSARRWRAMLIGPKWKLTQRPRKPRESPGPRRS